MNAIFWGKESFFRVLAVNEQYTKQSVSVRPVGRLSLVTSRAIFYFGALEVPSLKVMLPVQLLRSKYR